MKKYFKRLFLALINKELKKEEEKIALRNESIPGGGVKKPQKP